MALFKWLKIPSGETVDVKAYQSWTVRWWSMERSADGSLGRSHPSAEIFTTKEDADLFADELRTAMRLLRDWRDSYRDGTQVTVTANH